MCMPKGTPGQRKVGFTFPPELVERLDEAKWQLRKTKAEIVIEAVEEYLDRHGVKKVKAQPRERPRSPRRVSA
jgi:metal-responsive CopG/Arc/MetJ family transcriptional regulator